LTLFNIPALDRMLPYQQQANTFRHESAGPPSSPESSSFLHELSKVDERGEVLIELTGNSSSAGKTSLLYLIVTFATLPHHINGIDMAGKNAAVVILDTDDRFDVTRLQTIMKNQIQHRISIAMEDKEHSDDGEPNEGRGSTRNNPVSDLSDAEVDSAIRESLQNIHIFRPQSFSSLIATLEHLPSYLLGLASNHYSKNRPLHSIIVDSASAFYWQLRAEEETRRVLILNSSTSTSTPANPLNYTVVMSKLRWLSSTFECPVLATTWNLSSSSHGNGPYLNPSFPMLPTLRLNVRRIFIPPFGPRVSAEQAESLRHMRPEVAEKQKFWVERDKPGLAMAGFGFVVSDQGVFVDEKSPD
jgi:hypothetical protein